MGSKVTDYYDDAHDPRREVRMETIKERIEREVKEQQAAGSARYAAERLGGTVKQQTPGDVAGAAAAASRNEEESEQDHWRKHFEISVFPKVGASDLIDFLTLCDLRGRSVPQAQRNDYVWLHRNRQEWMLEFSGAENRALLTIKEDEAQPDPEYVRGYSDALAGAVAVRAATPRQLNSIGGVSENRVPESFQEMLDWLFGMNFSVMMDRQRKYGPGNIPKRGTSGTMTRMVDKFARLEFAEEKPGSLERAWIESEGSDESIEDTLIDIANYATIMRAQLRGWWTTKSCPPVKVEG